MTDDKITVLLQQEEKLLLSGIARTMKTYNQSGKVTDLRDYEAAKKALEEFRRKKAVEHDPDKQAFRNILEVLDYLQMAGWKIQKSALYSKQYAIKKQPDGSMLKKDVDDFAGRFLRKLDGSDTEEGDFSKKIEAEIRKLTAEAEKKEIEVQRLRGEVVDRSEVEQQLAARAAFLKNSLEGFFHSMAPRLIEKAEGNPDRTPEVVDFCLAELDELLDHYSKPHTFSVPAYNGNEGKEDADAN